MSQIYEYSKDGKNRDIFSLGLLIKDILNSKKSMNFQNFNV